VARDTLTCSCGAPAVVVFETEKFGPVGWCGRTNVGDEERSDEPQEAVDAERPPGGGPGSLGA